MNNDIIRREALKDLLNEYNKHFTTFTDIQTQIILDIIDHTPTVDVEKIKSDLNPTVTCWHDFDRGYEKGYEKAKKELEERPQGDWNYIQAGMCVCPFCGAMPHKLYKNFCAKCGAKMKGGAE